MDSQRVISDAELINRFTPEEVAEPAPVIKTQAPSSSEVNLLVGVVIDGVVETTAEVRELTGDDEEAIAKAGSLGKALSLILSRGVVKIGDHKATEDMLDALLAGDRDLLMLGIRRVTFGETLPISAPCDRCMQISEVELNLDSDVPMVKNVGINSWNMSTSLGELSLSFYNGVTQKKLMDNLGKTSAEISTLILAGSITSLDGSPVIAVDIAKKLSMGAREEIIKKILSDAPGPRLLEVKTACKACGEVISAPLSLASLFRL
jgi:hypothetical protein